MSESDTPLSSSNPLMPTPHQRRHARPFVEERESAAQLRKHLMLRLRMARLPVLLEAMLEAEGKAEALKNRMAMQKRLRRRQSAPPWKWKPKSKPFQKGKKNQKGRGRNRWQNKKKATPDEGPTIDLGDCQSLKRLLTLRPYRHLLRFIGQGKAL